MNTTMSTSFTDKKRDMKKDKWDMNAGMSQVYISDEVVVERGCSRFGLERMHIMRMGEAVDLNGWVERIEAGEKWVEWVCGVVYGEEGLGVHHLRLYWRERAQDGNEPRLDAPIQEV